MMPGNDVAESFQHAAMIFLPALAISRAHGIRMVNTPAGERSPCDEMGETLVGDSQSGDRLSILWDRRRAK